MGKNVQNKIKQQRYIGRSPLTALAVIGGAIKSSSIISSASSSPVDDDLVGD